MRAVAVIQARMGSTRLPGKVLTDLEGETMLARVVARSRRARRLHAVVVATSDRPSDDVVAAEAGRLGVPVFRGSEDDVLGRFAGAARAHRADAVVRITADCPLIDPAVIDWVVGRFLETAPDYASNTLRRTFPRGLDVEVITSGALAEAAVEATAPADRAHVTPFIHQQPERYRLESVELAEDWSSLRWTVDTAADLELARELYRRLGGDVFGWRQALELVVADPDLARINLGVRQKGLEEV